MKLNHLITATVVSAFFGASAFAQPMRNGMQSTNDNTRGDHAMQSQTSMQQSPTTHQNPKTAPPPSRQMQTSGNVTIRQAQERLNAQGYKAGPTDGVWGSKTRAALMKFQKAKDITPTGVLDQKTMMALGISGRYAAGARTGSMEKNAGTANSMMKHNGQG